MFNVKSYKQLKLLSFTKSPITKLLHAIFDTFFITLCINACVHLHGYKPKGIVSSIYFIYNCHNEPYWQRRVKRRKLYDPKPVLMYSDIM